MPRTPLTALLLLPLLSPAEARSQVLNPYERDPAARRAGAALYANRCADCHGPDAKGFSGPDLTMLWEFGSDDAYVFETIRRGVSGSIMPASSAPEAELWAIVSYLKSVGAVPEGGYERGDASRGADLFSGACTRCHRAAGEGGRIGPDLTRITAIRSRESIERSIRDPDATVARGYRPVELVTSTGEHVRGVVKGEDAFSIQILDTRERLQGYVKADLVQLDREPGSLMPPFGTDRLSAGDLDDLLSYLASARDRRAPERGR